MAAMFSQIYMNLSSAYTPAVTMQATFPHSVMLLELVYPFNATERLGSSEFTLTFCIRVYRRGCISPVKTLCWHQVRDIMFPRCTMCSLTCPRSIYTPRIGFNLITVPHILPYRVAEPILKFIIRMILTLFQVVHNCGPPVVIFFSCSEQEYHQGLVARSII